MSFRSSMTEEHLDNWSIHRPLGMIWQQCVFQLRGMMIWQRGFEKIASHLLSLEAIYSCRRLQTWQRHHFQCSAFLSHFAAFGRHCLTLQSSRRQVVVVVAVDDDGGGDDVVADGSGGDSVVAVVVEMATKFQSSFFEGLRQFQRRQLS